MEFSASFQLVSVVIPCLGRPDLTRRCLDFLLRQSLPARHFEIILVENGGIPSLAPGDSLPANARRLALDANYGTAGGFNRGIAATKSKYVLLLNNDVELEPDFLTTLLSTLENDPQCAFASGKLLRAADRSRLDGAGDALLQGGGAYRLGHGDADEGQFERKTPILSACAAAALFRRSVLEEIGGFDEEFFAYLDDMDACLRAQLAGYSGIYIPSAVGYHIGSATLGDSFHPKIAELLTRNQLFLWLKNYPPGALLQLWPRILVFQGLWLALAIRKGAFLPWLRGAFSAWQSLPEIKRKRRAGEEIRRMGSQQFRDLLRQSERQICQWHSSRPENARSTLLNVYFRLFPSERNQ